jgi:hypothetical protein
MVAVDSASMALPCGQEAKERKGKGLKPTVTFEGMPY